MKHLIALLFCCSTAFGQSVTLPERMVSLPGTWVVIAPSKVEGGMPNWRIGAGLQEVDLSALLPPEMVGKLRGKVVTAEKPGLYVVEAWNAKADKASQIATCVVEIKGSTPPIPPTPPTPPDPPVPPPSPAPIPVDGFRVLIIFDDEKTIPKLPEKQQQIIYSLNVREYLDKACAKSQDGTPEYRMFPVKVQGAEKVWADAMARPRTSLPWMVVSNGKTGWEGPLPGDVAAAMEIFKKHEK